MPTSPQPPSSPDFLLYTVYIPPIQPTPVPSTPPTREDQLLIALTWSDGVRKFNPPSKHRDPEADPHTDVDFYRPIRCSDNKASNWLFRPRMWQDGLTDSLFRRKVGVGKCMIFELPDGYTLYEKVHIPAMCRKKARTRRTTHLFGHPSGEPFKTPDEFQRHYVWMACDPLKDPKNCKCSLCRKEKEGRKEKPPTPGQEPATHSTSSANSRDSVGSWGPAPEPRGQEVATGEPIEDDW